MSSTNKAMITIGTSMLATIGLLIGIATNTWAQVTLSAFTALEAVALVLLARDRRRDHA
ncbi:hypothetical protein AAFP35_16875 [Gordonia sp. CPCC 206044]|uniref:hypothetical protein n=1 Tax=Gordonia sp. CPCC 206044 TaxID=3140793 RepID=UPI003AF38791